MSGDNKERIKAIISAAVIIIVNLFAIFGVNSIDGDELSNALLIIADLVAIGWGIWKNHNFTDEAAIAQVYLDNLKAAKKRGDHAA